MAPVHPGGVGKVRPVIHLTNWPSRRLHHGRVFTIMARPRHWEHGAGTVEALVPPVELLDNVRAGNITAFEYMETYSGLLREAVGVAQALSPGVLIATFGGRLIPVEDGDTLCCACSVDAAKRWECHRAPAAVVLMECGWQPVVDGFALCCTCAGHGSGPDGPGSCVDCEGRGGGPWEK
jgi:hypothetical protein